MIDELRHSPRLPEILTTLQSELDRETQSRQTFYEEMMPEQKVEFIDGEVVLHSPARNQHLDVTKYIAMLLNPFVEMHDLGTIKIEKCLVVFPRNDYEPDIVFFRKDKAKALQPDTMKFPIPDLVVEVLSESTEKNDRGIKFEDFQSNGVAEYWIVDAERSTVEQYLLQGGTYELVLKSSNGTLQSQVITGFSADIEAFFDKEKNLAELRAIVR